MNLQDLMPWTWTFGDEYGTTFTNQLRLDADGTISGYTHSNEARWGMDIDGTLVFMNISGEITSRFQQHEDGSLTGPVPGHPGKRHFLKRTIFENEEVVWSRAAEEFLQEHRIFLAHPRQIKGVYGIGDRVHIPSAVTVEPYSTMPTRGFCSIGAFSYACSPLPSSTRIGRYCSIAEAVKVMGSSHPINRVTTSPVTYDQEFETIAIKDFGNDFRVLPYEHEPEPSLLIGNDVWIGEGVLLKRDVKIGDGAVIAARSVVTKDVPPYSVVAGAPAVVKKLRFSEEDCQRLTSSAWWRYRYCDLPKQWDDVTKFHDQLSKLETYGKIAPFEPGKLNLLATIKSLS